MGTIAIYFTAVGLAMDAFAVSISSGMCIKKLKLKHALKFGLYFGFFQFLMPVIGFIAANSFSSLIEAYDHWVAFGLLVFIGGKMIYETFQEEELECNIDEKSILNAKNMIVMSIATSIDAMAVGVSYAVLNVNIIYPAVIIGLITFFLSTLGALLGKRIGCFFQKSAERLGGIVLILIGTKILLEHLGILMM